MSGFMLGPGEHAHGLESQQSYTWVFYIPKFLTNHEQINKEDIFSSDNCCRYSAEKHDGD